MSFQTPHRRRLVLEILNASPNWECSQPILEMEVVRKRLAAGPVGDDLRWLEARELVTLARVGETQFARLTVRGLDVAEGRDAVDGLPREWITP
jgi:hypothetical protein